MSWSGTFLHCCTTWPGADVLWHCSGLANNDIILLKPTVWIHSQHREVYLWTSAVSLHTVYHRAKFVFILPGTTVSTHGSRNNVPCGWRILHAKERTPRLTSLVPLHSALTHTQALKDTEKHVWACLHSHTQLLSHYTQTQTYMQRYPWAALLSTAYIGTCLVRQHSNWNGTRFGTLYIGSNSYRSEKNKFTNEFNMVYC